jgi:plastocyanin
MRTLILASLCLCLGACGDDEPERAERDASAQPDEKDAAVSGKPCSFTISLVDYKLEPSEVDAESGTIEVCAKNDGRAPHDLAIRDDAGKVLGRTKVLGQNESDRFTIELEAGAFDIFCTQAGHESLGMRGTLTVE